MPALLPRNWDVPQLFRDRLGAQAGRQRTMKHDGHVLVILHDLPNPDEPDQRSAQLFWRPPDGKWRSTKGSAIATLSAHVEAFAGAIEGLEQRVERASRASDYFSVLHEVAPLRRASRHMQQALQEARDAAPADRELITVRDRAGDVERAAELIHGYARDGLDFTVAKRSEEQAEQGDQMNRSAHRLNMIAAVFLPITAVGSVLGMNLQHGFETSNAPWLFWGVTVASFLLGFAVKAALGSGAARG